MAKARKPGKPESIGTDTRVDSDAGPADEADPTTALIPVLEAEYEVIQGGGYSVPDTERLQLAIKTSQENDPWNTWRPAVDETKVMQFLSASQVQSKKDYVMILMEFFDIALGKRNRIVFGQHVLKKIADANLHRTGHPFALTYKGVVATDKGSGKAHGFNVYPFTAAEREKLFKVSK